MFSQKCFVICFLIRHDIIVGGRSQCATIITTSEGRYNNIDCYEGYSKTSPEVIPGAFYFPEAKPGENRRFQGSPRETSFTVPRGKTVNICYITS